VLKAPLLGTLGTLATLAALALAATVAAYWGWRWLGPTSGPRLAAPVAVSSAPGIEAAHLFGRPAGGGGTAGPMAAPSAGAREIRLLGVFAGRDGRGQALVRSGSQPARLVRSGQEIEPGLVLASVEPNAIVISDGGTERRIELRVPAGAAPAPGAPAASRALPGAPGAPAGAPGAPAGAPGAPAGAPGAQPAKGSPARAGAPVAANASLCRRPADFDGDLYLLRAELLQGMIRQPEGWRGLIRQQDGGLVVSDSTGFAAMLGLRAGDRVERANGVALLSYEDVAAHLLQPLTVRQRVVVSGARDGKLRQWMYVDAASCAPG
jgi:hypothetical protein